MNTMHSRRRFVQGTAALTLATFLADSVQQTAVFARQASATPIASLGLPELTVAITDDSFTVSPAEIASGRYLVTVTNDSAYPDALAAAFLLLEGEATLDTLNAALHATGPSEPPAWLFTAWSPGGIAAGPGTSAQVVVDLEPGSYAVHPDASGSGHDAAALTVTGEAPASPEAIVADNTITLVEMTFQFDKPLAAGTQTLSVVNAGAQSHFAAISTLPSGSTLEDFEELMASFGGGPNATPVETKLKFTDVAWHFGTTTQSPGTTLWAQAAFDPGTYLIVCFAPDPSTGMPHAMQGMVEVFDIA